MSIRVQKSWAQLGSPHHIGPHEVPGLGTILNITAAHLDQAEELGQEARAVLEHVDSDGFEAEWNLVELRPAN